MASARVVKRGAAAQAGSAVVLPQPSVYDREQAVRLLAEAEAQAREIVAAAEREAAALRAAVETEIEELQRQLWEAALTEARAQLEQEFAAEQRALLARLRGLVERAVVQEQEIRQAYAHLVVELAVLVAETILRREIARDERTLGRLAEAALAHAPSAPVTHVIVHPEDAELARIWLAEAWNGRPPVEVVGDPHVDRGSCVLGTPVGFVDARLSTQLEAIRRALAEVADEW
ncbi:MAG: FliH/SctL family protein [Thermomicrobium sp.]|nr:FliH/SctL family protein [Thermomicrobium sp.]MDW8061020.1 FliH/SctL family protein [Thermomicrobium sp.]